MSRRERRTETAEDSAGHAGVPASVTIAFAREWVKPRLSPKRFRHVQGVAELARSLADKSGVAPFLAELAGWLHDACKELKAKELLLLANEYGLAVGAEERNQGQLLHGPVGAEVVKAKLGITDGAVLDAIREHTLGAAPMSPLSQIVFLADCLEYSRPASYTGPIWEALDVAGSLDLDRATQVALDLNLALLLEEGKLIHSKTVSVRNYYLELVKSRA